LGDAIGGADVPATAAPARAEDVSGLPPTFVEVGELDIFRDESIQYARRIAAARGTAPASGLPAWLRAHRLAGRRGEAVACRSHPRVAQLLFGEKQRGHNPAVE
jgi:acetyl esterase/lipase